MDLQQIRLGLVLREAGVSVNVRSFADRLIMQKTGYLLQQAGVPLGYHFAWYLRGPYSPDYTDDVFALAGAGGEVGELDEWKLDPTSLDIVGRVKGLFEEARCMGNNAARWLELLASALFLIRTRQVNASDTAGIVDVLRKNDKFYSAQEVEDGLAVLRRYGFQF